ncbi:MAG: hypothetical protein IJJ41_04420 [Clostridia bacterium]|nr:hypothetical protein [Clostridia bacterium]
MMIYTPHTKKALKLCFQAHKGQTDKGDAPYVFHAFHLAEQMTEESAIIVALLHDVAEDSAFGLKVLEKQGFSKEVMDALHALKHKKSVPYMKYISGIKRNALARQVKLADLKHNSDLSRLNEITDKDKKRRIKYQIAIALLEEEKYDSVLDCVEKKIPLDNERLCFFTVRYRGDTIEKASFDIEYAHDEHYELIGRYFEKLISDYETEDKCAYEMIAEEIFENGYLSFTTKLTNQYFAKLYSY